jgi:hypothetical protein
MDAGSRRLHVFDALWIGRHTRGFRLLSTWRRKRHNKIRARTVEFGFATVVLRLVTRPLSHESTCLGCHPAYPSMHRTNPKYSSLSHPGHRQPYVVPRTNRQSHFRGRARRLSAESADHFRCRHGFAHAVRTSGGEHFGGIVECQYFNGLASGAKTLAQRGVTTPETHPDGTRHAGRLPTGTDN